MKSPLVDLSDRYIPSSRPRGGGLPHIKAIAPQRVFPPRDAVEVLYAAFVVLAAGISKMLNPNTGTGQSDFLVGADYQGHIDYMIVECADVNPGTFPNNLFAAITFNAGTNPVSSRAYPIFPYLSSGSAASVAMSLTVPLNLDIPPATLVELLAASTDPAVHHMDAYLHAWVWPKSETE